MLWLNTSIFTRVARFRPFWLIRRIAMFAVIAGILTVCASATPRSAFIDQAATFFGLSPIETGSFFGRGQNAPSSRAKGPASRSTSTITVAPGEVQVNSNGICSLREAIVNANDDAATYADCPAGSGTDTIVLATGSTYQVVDFLTDNVGGPVGLPAINSTIVIEGNGSIIERRPPSPRTLYRLFMINAGGDLSLRYTTVQKGFARGTTYTGGGLLNLGSLTLDHCTIAENTAAAMQVSSSDDCAGGGVLQAGTSLQINDTIFRDNLTDTMTGGDADGGGICIYSSVNPPQIINSTFTGNMAKRHGGAISARGSSSATGFSNEIGFISGSTFTGNGGYAALGGGASIVNSTISWNINIGWLGNYEQTEHLTCNFCTITENGKFGVMAAEVRNSIVINNNRDHAPCFLNSLDICNGFGTLINGSGAPLQDHIGTVPSLSGGDQSWYCPYCTYGPIASPPLSNNGGTTPTQNFPNGSVVVDRVPIGIDGCGTTITSDQRGNARAVDGDGDGKAGCDLGAVEMAPRPATGLTSISGIKTVCPSGCDYTSLTGANGAFAAINGSVMTGNIDLSIAGDLTEDGSIGVIRQQTDVPDAPYTVTIKPSSAVMRTISGSIYGPLIRLSAARSVTIDGRFGGTGRFLTFRNTAPDDYPCRGGCGMSTVSLLKDALENTVRSSIIEIIGFNGDNGAVVVGDNLEDYFGIIPAIGAPSNSLVTDNLISYGGSDSHGGGGYGFAGLRIRSGTGTVVSRNRINKLTTFSSVTAARAVVLSGPDVGTTLVNNMVTTFGRFAAGIYDITESGSVVKSYYNTVLITGDDPNSTSACTRAYVGDNRGGGHTARNNICFNASSGSYAAAVTLGTGDGFLSDYNLFVGWGGAANPDRFMNGGTFAEWQARSFDTHSRAGNPGGDFTTAMFVGPNEGDLHINPAGNSLVSNTGTPIPGIDTDIDGNPRDPNNPDIGADEFLFETFGGIQAAPEDRTYDFTFGGRPVSINVRDDGTDLDMLQVTEVSGNHPNASFPQQTGQYWTIHALKADGTTPATADYVVDITLPYAFADSSDKVCRHAGAGVWDCASNSFVTNTSITRTGISHLSDWAVANFGTTAAGVSVSGRVTTPDGRGLTNAIVTMTDASGGVRQAITGPFGYYRFEDVPAGGAYFMVARSKRFRFTPRLVTVGDELTDVDFIASSELRTALLALSK